MAQVGNGGYAVRGVMKPPPVLGERIMIFKPEWILNIMIGAKTLEIRGTRLTGRSYLLGCKGKIYARAAFGKPFHIETTEQWNELRPRHRVGSKKLPYKKTWGLPLEKVVHFKKPHAYEVRRGPVGIVIFKPVGA